MVDGVPSNCMTRQGMTAHIIFIFVALVFLLILLRILSGTEVSNDARSI